MAVLLVVLPPDVAEGDVLVTSDPYASTVRFFLLPLMVDHIYIYGVEHVDYSITIFDYCALSFSCAVIPLELSRTPTIGVPSFPGGSTMEA